MGQCVRCNVYGLQAFNANQLHQSRPGLLCQSHTRTQVSHKAADWCYLPDAAASSYLYSHSAFNHVTYQVVAVRSRLGTQTPPTNSHFSLPDSLLSILHFFPCTVSLSVL